MKKTLLIILILSTPLLMFDRRYVRIKTITSATLPVAGYIGWYKSDIGVTSSGGSVSAWADQSGNGNDFSSLDNPTLVSAAISGYPAIQFNGTSNIMLSSGLQPGTATYFFAMKPISQTAFGVFMGAKTNLNVELRWDNATQHLQVIVNGASSFSGSTNVPFSYNVFSLVLSTSTAFYINQVSYLAGSPSTPGNASAGITIGGRFLVSSSLFSNYEMAEMIVYPSALNGTDRGLVETYLKTKYGI